MEGNTEAPQAVETPPAMPTETQPNAAFTPITLKELSALPQPGTEMGLMGKILSKLGMLKQPEAPSQTPEAAPNPSGLAVETNTVDTFASNKSVEDLAALDQARAALEAEKPTQQPTAPQAPVSPAVQRMESGQGVAKVTS